MQTAIYSVFLSLQISVWPRVKLTNHLHPFHGSECMELYLQYPCAYSWSAAQVSSRNAFPLGNKRLMDFEGSLSGSPVTATGLRGIATEYVAEYTYIDAFHAPFYGRG